MPRTKKNLTQEEQLTNVTNKISETKALLSRLREEKRLLEEQIRQENLNQLYDLIQESGRTLEDVRLLLSEEECEEAQAEYAG